MNPALRRSAAHAFVESLAAPVLDDADQHHLRTVLRLRDGETVSVADGSGAWRTCRFIASGALQIDSEIFAEAEPAPAITIGFALAKGDRPEWIVQKLTEIGVDRIVVVLAERSIVRWDESKLPRQLDRLRKVAREASMQSRRLRVPVIEAPESVGRLVAAGCAVLAEPGGAAATLACPTILIGPEGGWSPGELEASALTVSLGDTVLRVETAAVVAAARLTALRSELLTE